MLIGRDGAPVNFIPPPFENKSLFVRPYAFVSFRPADGKKGETFIYIIFMRDRGDSGEDEKNVHR